MYNVSIGQFIHVLYALKNLKTLTESIPTKRAKCGKMNVKFDKANTENNSRDGNTNNKRLNKALNEPTVIRHKNNLDNQSKQNPNAMNARAKSNYGFNSKGNHYKDKFVSFFKLKDEEKEIVEAEMKFFKSKINFYFY